MSTSPALRSTAPPDFKTVLRDLVGPDGKTIRRPTEECVHAICHAVQEELLKEENVVSIDTPELIVVGDLHGQFFDLLHIFRISRDDYLNLKNHYLFLGDYVDRGAFSIELILTLFLIKILHPTQVTLLRGNHEVREINRVYGFFDECEEKYNGYLWKTFNEAFDYLPIAALYGKNKDQESNRIFFVHGGISPKIPTIEAIACFKRYGEIGMENPLTDLLWSDPEESNLNPNPEFIPSARGSGLYFNAAAADSFCQRNHLAMICRSHQLATQGYFFFFPSKSVMTVWSAPQYCHKEDNVATVLKLNQALTSKQFLQFDRQEEPKNAEKAV